MDNCLAKLSDASRDEVARSTCADLLDPTACEFVSGRSKPRPNPAADAADSRAEGSLTDLTQGR